MRRSVSFLSVTEEMSVLKDGMGRRPVSNVWGTTICIGRGRKWSIGNYDGELSYDSSLRATTLALGL